VRADGREYPPLEVDREAPLLLPARASAEVGANAAPTPTDAIRTANKPARSRRRNHFTRAPQRREPSVGPTPDLVSKILPLVLQPDRKITKRDDRR
jgi:hypothetical protein